MLFKKILENMKLRGLFVLQNNPLISQNVNFNHLSANPSGKIIKKIYIICMNELKKMFNDVPQKHF